MLAVFWLKLAASAIRFWPRSAIQNDRVGGTVCEQSYYWAAMLPRVRSELEGLVKVKKMPVEEVRNAPVREEYEKALLALKPIMFNLPPIIVAIDGRSGSGKTTLGRFLAWRFNVTLIETDLFMHRNKGEFTYRNDQIAGIIDHRLESDRPVIVEGVVALRLLAELEREHAFHIHLICDESEGSSVRELEWEKYDADYRPSAKANLRLELPPCL